MTSTSVSPSHPFHPIIHPDMSARWQQELVASTVFPVTAVHTADTPHDQVDSLVESFWTVSGLCAQQQRSINTACHEAAGATQQQQQQQQQQQLFASCHSVAWSPVHSHMSLREVILGDAS